MTATSGQLPATGSWGGTTDAATDPWVWAGRVADLADLVQQPSFVESCVRRHEARDRRTVGKSEQRSWERSWPYLADALVRAGLGHLHIYLEYTTPGGANRFDALLLGRTEEGLPALVVVELKQWTRFTVLSGTQVQLPDGGEPTHPVVQVAGYTAFLHQWFTEGDIGVEVRGLVYLHNATAEQAQPLRQHHGTGSWSGIPVLCHDDLAPDVDGRKLAQRLLAADLTEPTGGHVRAFQTMRWTPSRSLLESVGDLLLSPRSPITLIGDQQDALLDIQRLVTAAKTRRTRLVVAVTGGPGSGKTIIASRLMGHYLRNDAALQPRYVSPSGTLVAQLREATSAIRGARDLFMLPGDVPAAALKGSRITILDEAQRLRRPTDGRGLVQQIVDRVPIVIMFLDERQIISPNEGITLKEIEELAATSGADFRRHSLSGCFRTNSSAAYMGWVTNLLYGTPAHWDSADYDLQLSADPEELQAWIDHHTDQGQRARTAAGFCWPWARDTSRLLLEVVIPWTDANSTEQLWKAPWNAFQEIPSAAAPHRNFWATAPGGHRQVGCIYTAQGLEYSYSGVIIGPDLVRRDGAWQPRPHHSHDRVMRNVHPDDYLPLTLNIYHVLLTRGIHATRLYSTDPETHAFLSTLITQP
ncbi:DNA/RNA helicase domain-containing protein [Kitasatospora sp. NPDC056651]|uniref:DNA/RNA helicase domain-containing protein n=1 Tax=Kitasatospora sp. NPDC056651 TaxID=3345892 RepID=UPI0036B893B2